MLIEQSEEKFLQHIASMGYSLEKLTAGNLVELALSFYRDYRAEDSDGVHESYSGDGLLFQWGYRQAYPEIEGMEKEEFNFDITRQFSQIGKEDDDALWQLTFSLYFEPTDPMRAIKSGEVWCWSPDKSDVFEASIRSSEAFSICSDRFSDRVELYLSEV